MSAPPHASSSFDVAIAGGGLAGLACAAALARRGLRVAVCEASGVLGGRASSQVDAVTGDAVDIGPHVITTEHVNFLALLRELGTDAQVHWQRQPLITLLDTGLPPAHRVLRMRRCDWPAPLHALPNLLQALRAVGWADLLSGLRLGWQAARLDEAATLELDDRDALSHLQALGVSRRMIDWFWRSAMLALLNLPLEQCSAAAMMRVARLLMGRSGAHFGFPRIGLGELYVPGCVAAVAQAGGVVWTDARVQRARLRDGRAAGMTLTDGRGLHAATTVLALPPAQAAGLLLQEDGAAPQSLAAHQGWGDLAERLRPVPYVCTLLWFDRPITQQRFRGAGVEARRPEHRLLRSGAHPGGCTGPRCPVLPGGQCHRCARGAAVAGRAHRGAHAAGDRRLHARGGGRPAAPCARAPRADGRGRPHARQRAPSPAAAHHGARPVAGRRLDAHGPAVFDGERHASRAAGG